MTFFAQAGIELPWKMHGRDFSQLMREPENAAWVRPTLYVHTGQDYGSSVTAAIAEKRIAKHAGVPYYAALCRENLKYVYYFQQSEPEELYDLASDPEETRNLAFEPGNQRLVQEFRGLLRSELELTDADLPRPN